MDDKAEIPENILTAEEEGALKSPEEVLQLMDKSMEFMKELMEENEKLRFREVQIQEKKRGIESSVEDGSRKSLLQQEVEKLEQEKLRLLSEYSNVEEQNKDYASRYIEIEDENNNLANLYVCSFQLHSTLDFREVIQIIMEIVINLIGAEEFGIYLQDEKSGMLKAVAMEGRPLNEVLPEPLGDGIIGQTAVSGENYFDPILSTPNAHKDRNSSDPLVSIPLKIKDDVIGVIALFSLLPQKTQFAHVDYELFTLLAGHAATAIFSAKLYSDAKRKLDTMQGFMDLLTSGE